MIELLSLDGDSVLINPATIESVRPSKTDGAGATVLTVSGRVYVVMQSMVDVLNAILAHNEGRTL